MTVAELYVVLPSVPVFKIGTTIGTEVLATFCIKQALLLRLFVQDGFKKCSTASLDFIPFRPFANVMCSCLAFTTLFFAASWLREQIQ